MVGWTHEPQEIQAAVDRLREDQAAQVAQIRQCRQRLEDDTQEIAILCAELATLRP